MKPLLLAAFGTFVLAGTASAEQDCFWSEDRGVTIQAPYQLRLVVPARRSGAEFGPSRTYGLDAWRRARLGRTGPNPFALLFGRRDEPRRACGEIDVDR